MPSGKTHDVITLTTAPLVATGTFFFTKDLAFSLQTTLFYAFAGFMFSGDLDIKSRQTKRWGFLKFIWTPYQKMFKHRSIFTHNFLLGTIIRILYLYIIAIGLYGVCQFIFNQTIINVKQETISVIEFIKKHPDFFLSVFLGITLGAFSHSIADQISTTYKKFMRKFK